jgi:hypothetical protein
MSDFDVKNLFLYRVSILTESNYRDKKEWRWGYHMLTPWHIGYPLFC